MNMIMIISHRIHGCCNSRTIITFPSVEIVGNHRDVGAIRVISAADGGDGGVDAVVLRWPRRRSLRPPHRFLHLVLLPRHDCPRPR